MSSNIVQGYASLGSRSRVLAGRSRSGRRPARRPSRDVSLDSLRRGFELFRKEVWKYWKENGRHDLPWRKTSDPYKILVSEIMLQQTQVDRVVPYYKNFLVEFPSVKALARASLFDVLRLWSGLGYNRRAKYLRDAATQIVEVHGGKVPRDYESLRSLPGVGDYTARAVRSFVFNEPEILIETNIRTAFIHRLFSGIPSVSDRTIKEQAEREAKGQDPRQWHWALMDYGAHLKRSGVRNNRKSLHYVRQSKFEGSSRQLRGVIVRLLQKRQNPMRSDPIGFSTRKRTELALRSLARDGLVANKKGGWQIA